MLLVMGISIITSRVILKTLGFVDFGINNVVGGLVVLFGFLNSSLAMGTQRFLTFHLGKEDIHSLQKIFSVSLLMHVFIAGLVVIIAETGGLWFLKYKLNVPVERKDAAFWVYQFSILMSVLNIVQVPYNAIIIAHERMNVFAYISIVEVLLKLGLVYLLTIIKYDKLVCFSLLSFVVQLIIASIYRIYCVRNYQESKYQLTIEPDLYKLMLKFSGWVGISSAIMYSTNHGINILLNIFFGPVVNAARAVSMQVNVLVSQFVSNFQIAVNPNITKLCAEDKKEELYTLLFQSMKFSFCLMWLFFLPIYLKIDPILKYWLTEVPEYTGIFCRLVLLRSLVDCLIRSPSITIQASGKMQRLCISVSLIYLTVLPFSYFVLKSGFPGYMPLVIYVIATCGDLLYHLSYLYKDINLPLKRLINEVFLPLLSIVMCSLPVSALVNHYSHDNFVSLLFGFFLSIILVLTSIWFIALNKNLRIQIMNKVFKKHFV
jgi:O-antigen/teichoic acid export membrane protein